MLFGEPICQSQTVQEIRDPGDLLEPARRTRDYVVGLLLRKGITAHEDGEVPPTQSGLVS